MTEEEIHNIYLHMSGKAEGIAEATGAADFPVLFAHAILKYAKRPWVGLTDEDVRQCSRDVVAGGVENSVDRFAYAIETKLKERNI